MDMTRVSQRSYAGVGARQTPLPILALMTDLGRALARAGWTLRSGGATGADQAFHTGARQARGRVELFLPWPSYEREHVERGDAPTLVLPRPARAAYEIAAECHPAWQRLERGPRALMARNSHEVLGADLIPARRASLLICWTPDATVDGRGRRSGGTGQAIRIARRYGTDVRNLGRAEHEHAARAWLAALTVDDVVGSKRP